MSKWAITDKYDLSHLSDEGSKEWEGCYIRLHALTYKEFKSFAAVDEEKMTKDHKYILEYANKTLKMFKDKFVDGKMYDGKAQIKMEAIDFDDMPAFLIEELLGFLVSSFRKKKGKR